MSAVRQRDPRGRSERGSVILMAAISMTILLLMVGMCIDISRIYVKRAELQNAADAAALTAARELNGFSAGITSAVAKANAIVNTQGLKTKSNVTVASVEFAVNLNDNPYMNQATAEGNPSQIRFVRVTTQTATTSILFGLKALGVSHVESRKAVAGKSVEISGICDFFPMAVALTNPTPAIGATFTLTFTKGTGAKCPPTVGGSDAKLCDQEYIILEVPDITGNGTGETAQLTAGLPNYCKKFGDNINMTPSSNKNNGPKNSGEGANTRMNGNLGDGSYPNGYGNSLIPSVFPPDANIRNNITYNQYLTEAPTVPSPNGPGKAQRRILVAPIISPGVYPNYTSNIAHWGQFFMKKRALIPQGNCDALAGCGALEVEYIGPADLGTAFGEPTCGSGLTTSVLYK